MFHRSLHRRSRNLLIGTATLFLLLPIPRLLPGIPASPGSWSLALLEVGVFLLLSAWVSRGGHGPGTARPRWLSAGPPWILALALGVLLLPRANQPALAAEGLLLGITGYLLFHLLEVSHGSPNWEPALLFSVVAPPTLIAATRLPASLGAGGSPPAGTAPAVWILLAIPLALRAALLFPYRIPRALFLLAGVTLGGYLFVIPAGFGWTILAISGGVSFLYALPPRRKEPSPLPGRTLSRGFLVSALVIILLGELLLFSPWFAAALVGPIPPDLPEEWEMAGGLLLRHPLGVGPGNLPDALAPNMYPPAPDGDPLAPWPVPRAGDLPRFPVELGWPAAALLVWGLAATLSMGAALVRKPAPWRARLESASLLGAVLAGTLGLFLENPLKSPEGVAILCFIASLTTRTYRASPPGPETSPRRTGPAAGTSPPMGRGLIVLATCAAAAATGIVALRSARTVIAEDRFQTALRGYKKGDWEAAHRAAAAALRLRPENLPARALLAATLRAEGDCREAVREYLGILERRPMDAGVSLRLLDCYGELGFVSDAVELSGELAERWPSSQVIGTKHAEWLERAGQPELAEEEYHRVILMGREFAPAQHGLAELLHGLGRSDEAVIHYRRAALADPENPENYIRLGDIRYSQEQYEVAAKYYATAVRVAGDDPEVLLRAGSAFLMIDRKCTALSLLDKALDLGLPAETLREIQPHLEELRAECAPPDRQGSGEAP